MSLLTCDECGASLITASHKTSCRQSWPKRGRRFLHATETWIPRPGAAREPAPCEITRVVHQSCIWYRTPVGRRAIPYDDFHTILGSWIS